MWLDFTPVLLIAIALAALIALGCRHWAFARRQRRIEQIIADIVAERQPASFSFYESPRFMRLGLNLETLFVRQQTLKQQIANEQFNLRAILSSMVEGVMVVGLDHTIQLANASLMSLFQLRDDPVGKSILTTLREAPIEELVSRAFATGEAQTSEISLSHHGLTSGVASHLTANAVMIEDANGKPRGAVVVFHDISRLRELEQVRREFVSNVSHELRTPLSIIHGYLENLADDPSLPREEVARILNVMQRHALRLKTLLDDLLTLGRLESRRDALNLEPINLHAFVEEIISDWQLKLARRHITARHSITPGLPPLPADRFRLQQVFNNLFDNAARYSRGKLAVSANADETQIHICVEDDGPGIAPRDLPHIFERFYRADKARSREAGGTGLGLSIVKHIVAQHGGSVTAESVFGKGAAIMLHFPREPHVDAE
jgi:two-component system, OmpR family, phosphate regulon sensor histidine kinase PhoR